MEEYAPEIVYQNLLKMAAIRNIKLSTPVLSSGAFTQELNHQEYVKIVGSRVGDPLRADAKVTIFLIARGSVIGQKAADFKKILKEFETAATKNEIIVVTDKPLTIHITKKINEFQRQNNNVEVENYDYEIFMSNPLEHVLVPKHEIASEKEIDEYCFIHCTSKIHFPKILQSDPPAVWIGLKPGNVVLIHRLSETSGVFFVYRYCVKN